MLRCCARQQKGTLLVLFVRVTAVLLYGSDLQRRAETRWRGRAAGPARRAIQLTAGSAAPGGPADDVSKRQRGSDSRLPESPDPRPRGRRCRQAGGADTGQGKAPEP